MASKQARSDVLINALSSRRGEQADHHERMARLANAYAAAYEGDVGYAVSEGQRSYLRARARAFRKDATGRTAKAKQLRDMP